MTDDRLRRWAQERKQEAGWQDQPHRPKPLSDSLTAAVNVLPSAERRQVEGQAPRRMTAATIPETFACSVCGTDCGWEQVRSGNERLTILSPRFAFPVWEREECACEAAERERQERAAERERAIAAERAIALRLRQNRAQSGLDGILRRFAFENFDPARSESMAAAAADMAAWAESFNPASPAKGFALASRDYGCGKTHLAAATGNALLAAGHSVRFATMAELLDSMRQDYARGTAGASMELAVRVQVLIIDDFGCERIAEGERGDWAREQVYTLFDRRVRYGRPVVVTTNLAPGEIQARIGGDHGGRIVSRLASLADWYEVAGPDGRLA